MLRLHIADYGVLGCFPHVPTVTSIPVETSMDFHGPKGLVIVTLVVAPTNGFVRRCKLSLMQ